MSPRAVSIALLALFVLGAAGCGGGSVGSSSATRTLTDLHNIGQLRAAFNTASSEPRLVVLVSPT